MRCGVIPMQFHFISYGMELYYTNDSIPINTNIEQCMCMRASLEHFGIFTFLTAISFNILSLHSLANHWQITELN